MVILIQCYLAFTMSHTFTLFPSSRNCLQILHFHISAFFSLYTLTLSGYVIIKENLIVISVANDAFSDCVKRFGLQSHIFLFILCHECFHLATDCSMNNPESWCGSSSGGDNNWWFIFVIDTLRTLLVDSWDWIVWWRWCDRRCEMIEEICLKTRGCEHKIPTRSLSKTSPIASVFSSLLNQRK